MKNLSAFTNFYQLSKTLRFEIQGNISKKLYQAGHRVGTNKNDIAGKAK
jgi:hypothetical protein